MWAYAEFTPQLGSCYKATAKGELTLPAISGMGLGRWTLLFMAVLAAAAGGMRWLEARHAPGRNSAPA